MKTRHEARNEPLKKRLLLRPLPPVRIQAPSCAFWEAVRSGLERLGFDVRAETDDPIEGCVVLVPEGGVPPANAAFILVSTEGSVKAAHAALTGAAHGYFAPPFDFLCMGISICVAARQAHAAAELVDQTQQLQKTVLSDQTISTAVGILMERLRLPRAEAFARLRQHSRSEQRKIGELAAELVSTSEELIRRLHVISGACD